MNCGSESTALFNAVSQLDFDSIQATDFPSIVPILYFSSDRIEDIVVERLDDFALLQSVYEQIELLDSLASVNLASFWYENKEECRKRAKVLSAYACSDFELQNSVEIRVKLIMQQLYHIIYENPSPSCHIFRCCSILESPSLHQFVSSCIAAIITAVPQTELLPDIVAGISVHSSYAGKDLIRCLILNFPHEWPNIWRRLLHVGTLFKLNSTEIMRDRLLSWSDSTAHYATRALAVLNFTLGFAPDAECVLDRCISLRCLPEFVLNLGLNLYKANKYCLISFFKRLFFDEGCETCEWFGAFFKTLPESNPVVIDEVNAHLLAVGTSIIGETKTVIPKQKLIAALEFLRIIATLRGFGDFTLSQELNHFVLQLIVRPTGVNERAVNFICYALAFTIGMRSCLIDSSTSTAASVVFSTVENSGVENEEQIVAWLRQLLARQDTYSHATSTDSSSSYAQLLLLLALLFHTNQQSAIRDLVSDVLGIDAPCLARNISASRKLFTQKVFSEQLIATQAANVPVTVKLNSRMLGHLPIHCVHQLLKSHAFSKNRVQIKGWIYRQVCESVRPLHSLLPDLIEAYTASCLSFVPPGMVGAAGSVPFTEAELLHQFSPEFAGYIACACAPAGFSSTNVVTDDSHEPDLTPQLLFLYYMLFIYNQELTSKASDSHRRHKSQTVSLFSDSLWDAIPITFLLQYTRAHLSDYRQFYPRLLQLVTNHMPHLTIGELIIQDELLLNPFWQVCGNSQSFNDFSMDKTELPCMNFISDLKLPSPSDLNAALDIVISGTRNSNKDVETCRTAAIRQVISAMNSIFAATQIEGSVSGKLRSTYGGGGSSDSRGIVSSKSLLNSLRLLLPYVETLAGRVPLALLASACLSGNRRFGRISCFLWRTLHSVMPQRLEVLTIQSLTSVPTDFKKNFPQVRLTRRDLFTDPVERIVMGIDHRVYRCPPVLHIVLRILECNLLASRSFWVHRVANRYFLSPEKNGSDAIFDTTNVTGFSNLQTLVPITSPLAKADATNDIGLKGVKRKKTAGNASLNLSTGVSSAHSDLSPIGIAGTLFAKASRNNETVTLMPASLSPRTDQFRESLARQSVSRPGTPSISMAGGTALASDEECDRLRLALVVSQDATVVQLLLEFCLPTEEEKALKSELTELREVRSIICIFIHYLFIVEPSLASVVFWQTYPRSIIPVAAKFIPSLHICMDSVIDVFRSSGSFQAIIFCLDFVSHLALHYNIRPLLDRATYLIDAMHYIFTIILSVEEIPPLILACLSAFCRIACAFPSLSSKIASIMLGALSMMANAASTLSEDRSQLLRLLAYYKESPFPTEYISNMISENAWEEMELFPDLSGMRLLDQYRMACVQTMRVFDRLVILSTAQRRLFLQPGVEIIS